MPSPLALEQLSLRDRPPGRPVMRQTWRDLLFLHFPCAPEEIAPLLPPGLTLDTFPDEQGNEQAWIGLVPFLMQDVHWTLAPKIPGTHTFPETNVRTYVHHEGHQPGVWFFSLDAMNRLAVLTARRAFSLPYFHAQMSVLRTGDRIRYHGSRTTATYEIEAKIGSPIEPPSPGSLEFFLIERYLLYAHRKNRLWTGRVHHRPYPLRSASPIAVEETLLPASGLPSKPFIHSVFSNGVEVDIFPLRPI